MKWVKHKYYLQGEGYTITKCGKENEYLYSIFIGMKRIDGVFKTSAEAIKHYELIKVK